MTLQYLVGYKSDKRRISVTDKQDLFVEIRNVFALPSTGTLKIKYEDPEWGGELVLVDRPEELPDRAKITVEWENNITLTDQSPYDGAYCDSDTLIAMDFTSPYLDMTPHAGPSSAPHSYPSSHSSLDSTYSPTSPDTGSNPSASACSTRSVVALD